MSAEIRNLVLAGVMVAAVGGGAIWFINQRAVKTAPVADTPTDHAGMDVPPPPPPPLDGGQVKFNSETAPYTLTTNSAAYVAPSRDAPQMYVLPEGTSFLSVGKSTAGDWILAMTRNGVPANIQTKDTGTFDPHVVPKADILRPPVGTPIQGAAQVIDSGRLLVNGEEIVLAGVAGQAGDAADRLRKSFDEQGDQVACTPAGASYVCDYANGTDIARVELYNGTVAAAPDANADYQGLQNKAKALHKGMWQ